MEPQQSAKGDANLVVEMIRLLSDELQRVQNDIEDLQKNRRLPTAYAASSSLDNADELYALQEENLRIRSRIEDVRATLGALHGGVRESPSKDGHLDVRLSELSEEAFKKDTEYTKTRGQLSAKIEAVREKYKEQKAIAFKLQESISEVETQITSVKGAHAEESQRLETLTGELAKQNALEPPFDSRAFLDEPSIGEDEIPLTASFPASGARLLLPEGLSKLCVPGGYMAKRSEEIAWSRHIPRTHCLTLGPTHRYNPKLRNSKGGWEAAEDAVRHMEDIEFFYRESQTRWCYLGTFRCVGRNVRSFQDLGKTAQRSIEAIRAKTVVFDYMIPQIIIDLLKSMYDSGLLKVACVGWRRIGFNQALAEALHAMSGVRLDQGPSTSIQLPKKNSAHKIPLKRDREEEMD